MIALHRIDPDQWQVWRALRLAALADSPEAFGSTFAEWSGSHDTEERWRARLESVPCNLVAEVDGVPVGMASGRVSGEDPEGGTCELISMWCAPEARGSGVGDALVDAIAAWARERGAVQLALDVRQRNHRAIALYARHGFVDAGPATSPGAADSERRMVLRLQLTC